MGFNSAFEGLIDISMDTILFSRTTRHTALFLCPWTLSTACNGTNDSQTEFETLWPWARFRWEYLVCQIYLADGSVATCTVVYHTSPTLLTFKILPFFCANPVFL